jgi:hypothetical protein
MDNEIQKILDELPNKKFSKLSDANLWKFENQIGRKVPEEHQKKMVEQARKVTKGKKLSDEHKKKIKKSNTGIKKKPLTDIHKKFLSDKFKGRIFSQETKDKISKSVKKIQKKPQEIERLRKLASEQKGKPAPHTTNTNKIMNTKKFICPHCLREIGGRANFVRFHNENCKQK